MRVTPARIKKYKEHLSDFASDMLNQLEKARASGKNDNWRKMSYQWLLTALKKEAQELESALMNRAPAKDVIAECADVANFAMFIADKITWDELSRKECKDDSDRGESVA